MPKILIISPHFPPSNLAAVHRSRLFAQHLPSFGWQPIVLTVHEDFYEEALDRNLEKLLPAGLRIEKVKALKVTRPRLIGDIGLRAFFQLANRAIQLIQSEKIGFLYIPIPSFYAALIGRYVHMKTGVKYGIDYIDPWVHFFKGSEKLFSRHWFSTKVSSFLEPIAIEKACLITGVSAGYYQGVLDRNPYLSKQAIAVAMPYGGEKADHEKVSTLDLTAYLFPRKRDKLQLVYAGAMLPKAYAPLETIFQQISNHPGVFSSLEIHFIGTGKSPNDANGFNIKPLAEKYNLWQQQVFEYPRRIPYLDALIHLEAADGAFILGSSEPHYTPSKVYQGVLSKKPLWAILHQESTACAVIRQSKAGVVLQFNGEQGLDKISTEFVSSFQSYKSFVEKYDYAEVNQEQFNQYSARSVTQILANALNQAMAL